MEVLLPGFLTGCGDMIVQVATAWVPAAITAGSALMGSLMNIKAQQEQQKRQAEAQAQLAAAESIGQTGKRQQDALGQLLGTYRGLV